jgi:hypothetical protein
MESKKDSSAQSAEKNAENAEAEIDRVNRLNENQKCKQNKSVINRDWSLKAYFIVFFRLKKI